MTTAPLPPHATTPPDDDALAAASFDSYFREGELPQDALHLWQLAQQGPLVEALRALFHGPADLVRLRLWVFVELMALPQAHIERDALNRHFHALRPEPLDLVIKRLRDVGLLLWDTGTQLYTVTPLAQQLMAVLAPLVRAPEQDADLAGLLASVAGAQQLGVLEPAQLLHLQAQLSRLHDEFADAITSGSEFRLRQAQRRFERALDLVDRASAALTAIITGAQGQARLEKLARDLGLAQARLLSMASQFNRALQQADRQRVTLGSTGITTTDLKQWLQTLASTKALPELLNGAFSAPVAPVFVAPHELLDVTEGEFERDRGQGPAEPLPSAQTAPTGKLEGLAMPAELGELVGLLTGWSLQGDAAPRDVAEVLLGGRFAQAAYRAQLMPLLGDPQAATLQGSTGDLARLPWRAHWSPHLRRSKDPSVRAMSVGELRAVGEGEGHLERMDPPADDAPAELPLRKKRGRKVASADGAHSDDPQANAAPAPTDATEPAAEQQHPDPSPP
jgi:hypothetical protein